MRLFGIFKSRKGKEESDLSVLEDNFVIHVGNRPCDICKSETNNCYKTEYDNQTVCLCPRKDIRGFNRPK